MPSLNRDGEWWMIRTYKNNGNSYIAIPILRIKQWSRTTNGNNIKFQDWDDDIDKLIMMIHWWICCFLHDDLCRAVLPLFCLERSHTSLGKWGCEIKQSWICVSQRGTEVWKNQEEALFFIVIVMTSHIKHDQSKWGTTPILYLNSQLSSKYMGYLTWGTWGFRNS